MGARPGAADVNRRYDAATVLSLLRKDAALSIAADEDAWRREDSRNRSPLSVRSSVFADPQTAARGGNLRLRNDLDCVGWGVKLTRSLAGT